MKLLFMGTPDFAVPSLRALAREGHEIVGVFCQPDKPQGRGMKMKAPPVKEAALALGIPVFQPEKLRDGTALSLIQELAPSCIIVAAYGRILPREMLDYPALGCFNVHSSLLPAYRGAAPIHWAMLNGDERTGVTIMDMVEALDAGDILAQAATPIDPNESVSELHDRLAQLGAALLLDTLRDVASGNATRLPQDEAAVTLAPMLSRALSPMDTQRPAEALHNQVRALSPWPSASLMLGGKKCKIWKTSLCDMQTEAAPGSILACNEEGILLACGEGSVLCIEELQAEGKRRMPAAQYANGNRLT